MAESSREEIAKLEALYAKQPEGRVFTHLAEAYRRAGELDRARTILEEGLVRHDGYASAHVVLGRVLLALQQTEEAEAAFLRVLGLDARNLVALRSLGDIARAAGRKGDALRYFEELQHQDPNNEEISNITQELRDMPDAEPEVPAFSDPEYGQDFETDTAPEANSDNAAPVGSSEMAEPSHAEEPPASAPPTQDADLGWIPADEDNEGLPGDLGELAANTAFSLEEFTSGEEPAESSDFVVDLGMGEQEYPDSAVEIDDLTLEPSGLIGAEPEADPDLYFEPEPAFETESVFEPAMTAELHHGEEPGTGDLDAPAEVLTETIAELYLAQGLKDRAAEVYRSLLRDRPDDPALVARLGEIEATIPEPAAWDPFAEEAPDDAEPILDVGMEFEYTGSGSADAETVDATDETAEAWLAGGAGAAENQPTPYAWAEQPGEAQDEGPAIGSYFATLLGWRPAFSAAPEEIEPMLLLDEPTEEGAPTWDVSAGAAEEPPPQAAAPLQAPAEIDAPPSGSDAATAGEAFDAWFSDEESETPAAAKLPAPSEDEVSPGDDDDLEMFRSWLQSLKK